MWFRDSQRWMLGCVCIVLLVVAPAFAGTVVEDSEDASEDASANYPDSLSCIQRVFCFAGTEVDYTFRDFISIHKVSLRWSGREWGIAGATLVAAGLLYANDQAIYDAVQRNKSKGILGDIHRFGNQTERMALKAVNTKYFFAGVVLGKAFGSETFYEIGMGTLESYVISGVTIQACWQLAGRSRPVHGVGPYFFKFSNDASFISGHVSNAFQIATVLSMNLDSVPVSVAAYGFAGVIAYQRIAEQRHWPSDVFLGAVHGAVIARAVVHRRQGRRQSVVVEPTVLGEYGTTLGLRWVYTFGVK